MQLFTFKLPLRFLAVLIGILSVFTINVWTYKALIQIANFAGIGFSVNYNLFELISLSISCCVGLGIIPLLWSKFSHWGQTIDNGISYIVFSRRYFLDKVELKLKKNHASLNHIAANLDKIVWNLATNQFSSSRLENIYNSLNSLMKIDINNLRKACDEMHAILDSNKAYDNYNKRRKYQLSLDLQTLTIQTMQTCNQIRLMLREIRSDIESLQLCKKKASTNPESLSLIK